MQEELQLKILNHANMLTYETGKYKNSVDGECSIIYDVSLHVSFKAIIFEYQDWI